MLTWRCRAAISLALVLACSASSSAQSPIGVEQLRVQLRLSADSELKPRLQKEFEGGLNALGNVQLVERDPEITISIISLKISTRTRRDMGLTFSVTVTESLAGQVRQLVASVDVDARDRLMALLDGAVMPLAHWVETASTGAVPDVCNSIIEAFRKAVDERPKAAGFRVLR